jgi:two-component system cell cycle sensor histidine kinase/response regulator CckA
MQAVVRPAGGIAHDFNNPLTVILGYAAVAKNKLGAESGIHRYMVEIQRAEHASALTGQLLAFSRKQVIQPYVLD